MYTLLFAVVIYFLQGWLRCDGQNIVSSRLDRMQYIIEQYKLGIRTFDSEQNDNANGSVAADGVAENRHTGPFDRTPLLSKVHSKQSRTDDTENEESSGHYEFNKTLGSYVILHRIDDNASDENETANVHVDLDDSLTANSFEISIPPEASSPSYAPANKSSSFCPSPYNPMKVDYTSNSLVEVNGFIFKCKYTKYCNYPSFVEMILLEVNIDLDEVTNLWLNAWSIVGECVIVARPSVVPTRKPSRKPTADATFESPTFSPTVSPSWSPTWSPTMTPTVEPTACSDSR